MFFVYIFRDKRLAHANGHSIQQAEMNAAKKALENSKELFPQLDHQKRVIAKSMKRQRVYKSNENLNFKGSNESLNDHSDNEVPVFTKPSTTSRLPKQYRQRELLSDVSEISSSSLDSNLSGDETEKSKKRNKNSKKKRKLKRKRSETEQSSCDSQFNDSEKLKEDDVPEIDKIYQAEVKLTPMEYSSLSESDNLSDFDLSQQKEITKKLTDESDLEDMEEETEIKTNEGLEDTKKTRESDEANPDNGWSTDAVQQPGNGTNYDKYVTPFKVEGTEDFSDTESGELV